tara:strand:+ start:562 stop:942 length:381 start_codon:yes stop_codon:yes gene_type:complete
MKYDLNLIMDSFKPLEELEKITMFESSKKIGVRPYITKKLEWLKGIIEELIKMDKYYNTPSGTIVHMYHSSVDEMLHNIKLGKLPRKKQLIKCNEILTSLKNDYEFIVNWRGEIEGERYTNYILNK